MKKFEFIPEGVCSVRMIIGVENNKICKVSIIGGCPGNSEGISRLCVGREIDEVISLLKEIDCRGRGTSCPDQLARGLLMLKQRSGDMVEN